MYDPAIFKPSSREPPASARAAYTAAEVPPVVGRGVKIGVGFDALPHQSRRGLDLGRPIRSCLPGLSPLPSRGTHGWKGR